MHIVSNNPLNYNDGINGVSQAVIKGIIILEQNDITNNSDQFQYQYLNNITGAVLEGKVFSLNDIEADGLYNLVKADLPDINIVGYSQWYKELCYLSFRYEMAQTFGIPTTDITIVP